MIAALTRQIRRRVRSIAARQKPKTIIPMK